MKITKEPWIVRPFKQYSGYWAYELETPNESETQAKANALLMENAPNLLHRAYRFKEVLEDIGSGYAPYKLSDPKNPYYEDYQQVLADITKVEGLLNE